ncbi:MAG: hypothetical protein ACI81Y_002799 [Glaciecola sp.]
MIQSFNFYPEPSTQHPAPSIQHPASSIQHPAPSTQHPAPSTQHPKLRTQSNECDKMKTHLQELKILQMGFMEKIWLLQLLLIS